MATGRWISKIRIDGRNEVVDGYALCRDEVPEGLIVHHAEDLHYGRRARIRFVDRAATTNEMLE